MEHDPAPRLPVVQRHALSYCWAVLVEVGSQHEEGRRPQLLVCLPLPANGAMMYMNLRTGGSGIHVCQTGGTDDADA